MYLLAILFWPCSQNPKSRTGIYVNNYPFTYCFFEGCDKVIDKSKEDLWKCIEEISPDGYHAIFDANGIATINESYNHLAPMGKLVVYGKLFTIHTVTSPAYWKIYFFTSYIWVARIKIINFTLCST